MLPAAWDSVCQIGHANNELDMDSIGHVHDAPSLASGWHFLQRMRFTTEFRVGTATDKCTRPAFATRAEQKIADDTALIKLSRLKTHSSLMNLREFPVEGQERGAI
jgi:hypothetical protein